MDILGLIVTLVILGLIFYVLWWGLSQISLPEPFNKIVTVLIVLAIVVILISLLTGHMPYFRFGR